MSDNRPIGNLSTYDARDWVTGESITRTKLQGEFNQIAGLIGEVKQALADIQSRRSNSGHSATENDKEGQIVHDSDSGLWYGDPDGSGADDQLATELSAYQGDYATAGTDTFKAGGLILSNNGGAAYSLPASTLYANGSHIDCLGWDTKSGGSSGQANVVFGTTALGPHQLPLGVTNYVIRTLVIRTGTGAQKFITYARTNYDASGSSTLCNVGSSTEDETTALAVTLGSGLESVAYSS